MGNFVILTDASSDLTQDIRERFDIDYIKGHLQMPDGRSVPLCLEWTEDYEHDSFYAAVKKGAAYATSPANVAEYAERMTEYVKEGKDILVICISTGLSGTYNFAVEAKNQVEKEYPNAKIFVVDSLRYSVLEGMICVKASQMRAEGKTIEETYEWIEANKNCYHQMGWLDDLSFVAKKGRMSNSKAFFGQLVGIKPLGDISSNGLTTVIGKAKGAKAGFEAILAYMEETIENPSEQTIFVGTSDREKDADKLVELIKEKFAPKEVIKSFVFPSCGVNIGPGLCAAFYYGKPISDDMKPEEALMNKILEKK
ncbi:MAG: DegV family protein [Lachnospiraceae bacterium]|nr:DegV family protein [Lachnospiraceae bacterium]